MWDCSNCGEKIEDGFEACWNCRSGKDGAPRIIPEEIADDAKTVLEPHLNPNESLGLWAYGIKPMPIETKLFLFLMSILFAVLAPLSVQIAYEYSWFGEYIWKGGEIDPSDIVTLIIFVLMAAPFYWITKSLLMENFVIGLTNQRLIALLCKNHFQVKAVLEYELDNLPLVKTSTGAEKAVIEIHDSQNPLSVTFHKEELPDNFGQAVAMANTLGEIKSRRASSSLATSYCPQCQAEFRSGFTHCNACNIELIEFGQP